MHYFGLDTETTGVDLYHGAMPYLVTMTDNKGDNLWWEWDVDPLTRKVLADPDEMCEVAMHIACYAEVDSHLVLQNPKFDATALATLGIGFDKTTWDHVYDTLLASHLLASNFRHDLTSSAMIYLGINIQPYEDKLKKACLEARRLAKSRFPKWRLAKHGEPDMPSIKKSANKNAEPPWKIDAWLPRALAKELKYPTDHPWWWVCSEYANADSGVVVPLFKAMEDELKRRDLWLIYQERLKVLRIAQQMEQWGVTLNSSRLEKLEKEYAEESAKSARICKNIAKGFGGYELELPKGGTNNSLRNFIFDVMQLPPVEGNKKKKTDAPSLDKNAMEHYMATLPASSKGALFIKNLSGKRKRDTALTYMEGYRSFWKQYRVKRKFSTDAHYGWYVLHPSLNPTATDTLRWASYNPNEQNISKQKGFNLRYCFGPAPGREWWSCDAKNIELRLPAYEAGEDEMIALFEKPDEPPYYGSNHLLVFDTLHPDKFAKHGAKVKEIYESTWYQWTKNGNFAVQYGAVEASGTADRAYHVEGAQRRIQQRFKKIAKLNTRMIEYANKHGYVETMPDKNVDPHHGYPLLCTRSKWGDILPTVPLNYHIQGTAMWAMQQAMIRCHAYLENINRKLELSFDNGYKMIMQVHDELVFDFPCGYGKEPWKKNKSIIDSLVVLMELSGDDIGIPLPFSCKYHAETWSEGASV